MLDFKKIFSSIADVGQGLIGKKIIKKDLNTALQLCNDLISFKGVASGIAIAREITEIYNVFDTDQKLNFFKEINKEEINEANIIDHHGRKIEKTIAKKIVKEKFEIFLFIFLRF